MIQIETHIKAPLEQVWSAFTSPQHIMNWNYANDDWHCPSASNELVEGGIFCYQMADKQGKFSFDFKGRFIKIIPNQFISYQLEDGRMVEVDFKHIPDAVKVEQRFEAEQENDLEMQRMGWQAILNNFGSYVERQEP